ncbi:MAG: phosphatase PAP2 family protein [Flavobacteriaceae bacterium]
MKSSLELNNSITNNFKAVNYKLLIVPFVLVCGLFAYYFINYDGGSYSKTYVSIQENLFYYLNTNLSAFPSFQLNITQIGDVFVGLSLISMFIILAPKLWEGLLASSAISLIASGVLKNIFDMPRPAKRIDPDLFVIIGERHSGYSSLPSGHSITIFVVFTILLFAFMPRKRTSKLLWYTGMLSLGFIVALSRVAIGAHFPIDVLSGSIIGFSSTVLGIILCNKWQVFSWLNNKKIYPIVMVVILAWIGCIVFKIFKTNLLIFYISILALLMTLYFIARSYVKNKN